MPKRDYLLLHLKLEGNIVHMDDFFSYWSEALLM
jgi:hypothetical protein